MSAGRGIASRPGRVLDGVLPVDKSVGPTSHDVVAHARQRLGIRRVGHTGTLDPFASGLLLLCLGRATRLTEYFHAFPKEYRASVRLGASTATDDTEGAVVTSSDGWRSLDRAAVAEALRDFSGDIEQTPPAFSAKKVDGVRAYERARRGDDVSLAPAVVRIHWIRLGEVDLPDLSFTVSCSTGTYIRAIARDLGDRLGVGGHLTGLRRTRIGPLGVDEALSLSQLDDPEAVDRVLVSPLDALAHLPRVAVTGSQASVLRQGQGLELSDWPQAGEGEGDYAVAVDSELVAVATRDGGWLRPKKVFPPGDSDA